MNTPDWPTRANDLNLHIRNFIDGRYTDISTGEGLMDKHSSRDGRLLYQLGSGTLEDVNNAAANAQAAFDDGRWCSLPLSQRQGVLHKLADLVETHREELALYESLDVGKPITQALKGDIPGVISRLRGPAELADKLLEPSGADGTNFSFQVRKPIGVVGAIVGWNYPLSLAVTKLAPALVMGNSVVLKPSEFTSLSASRLAELAIEAGVPPGVFNVVHGAGNTVGAALSLHQDVRLLSFTGSSATGKQLMIAAGQSNMKRVILECGGKSPYLVFDDCPEDLDFLATDIVETAFANQGALCVSSTRLLVQDTLLEKLLPKIIAETEKLTPQDPLNSDTSFGAIINEAHLNKILAYIESGKQEGAKLITGGNRIEVAIGGGVSEGTSNGYYIKPAIFTEVDPEQKIAQEEIFGPVLSIFTFKDEAEAIQLANNSCYGLAAYAATTNLSRAYRLTQSLNAGYVFIIGTATPGPGGLANLGAEPHRESGMGTESGLAGLVAYSISSVAHMLT
ncbi:aldehyde dehydrogenase family protein [Porticoccaceae bacterium]|nr:aldehyde dehydrogenase family protein [Porticoccaceae bacterium]